MAGSRELGWATTIVVAHPSSELYGADRMLLESVVGFIQCGARTIVVLPQHGPLVDLLRSQGAHVLVRPVPVLRKSALRPAGLIRLVLASMRSLPGMIRLLRSCQARVVYVSTVTVPLWLVAARLARVAAVVHVHEAEHSVPRWIQRGLAAPLLLAGDIMVNSAFSKRVLTDSLPRKGAAAVVVDNGVAGPPEVEPARTVIEGPLRLLYLGRLSPRKGPHVALEAVAVARDQGLDVELDLLGDVFRGYEWYRDELNERIARLHLADSVRVHGFQDSVWPALRRCDALLVPSTVDEPFGNTAVEGILAGRPLVVSATSGLLEAAQGYGSVLWVKPDDVGDLARAMHEVRQRWSELRREALRDAARAAERHAPSRYRSRVAQLTTGAAA